MTGAGQVVHSELYGIDVSLSQNNELPEAKRLQEAAGLVNKPPLICHNVKKKIWLVSL